MNLKLIKRIAAIFFLGVSSGLPLALILSTLKAVLVDRGFDLKTIGFFSLVSLPYTFKFCFAPIIDSCRVPLLTRIFGQRKSWIILTQLLLAIFIFALGAAGVVGGVSSIAVFALLVAFASASQDVVIDGYRIELVEQDDQGFAASFYVYGYHVGMLISGAVALAMSQFISWDEVHFIMAGCMVCGALVVIFIEETRRDWQPKHRGFLSWIRTSVVEPFADIMRHSNWFVILLFIVFFKLADAFAGTLTLPFLLEIGFSKIEYASIVKTFGLFATLAGIFIGGIMIKKIHITKSLWIAAVAQILSNLTFSYLSRVGHDPQLLYGVIFIENFSGGIGSTIFVAYLSSLCSVAFSATQYALLASLATLARSFVSSSAGIAAQAMGWFNFFVFSAVIALPGLVFLWWLQRSPRDRGAPAPHAGISAGE